METFFPFAKHLTVCLLLGKAMTPYLTTDLTNTPIGLLHPVHGLNFSNIEAHSDAPVQQRANWCDQVCAAFYWVGGLGCLMPLLVCCGLAAWYWDTLRNWRHDQGTTCAVVLCFARVLPGVFSIRRVRVRVRVRVRGRVRGRGRGRGGGGVFLFPGMAH